MKSFLYFLSLFYRIGPKIQRWMYEWNIKKQKSVPIPIISVGNITFGGSEKTPLSIKLIKNFLKKGLHPAFISRGYKGKWEKCGGAVLPPGHHIPDWNTIGDEPYMTAKNVPEAGIFLGKDRISSCMDAYKKGYNIAVLDDGFQFYPLKRDLDIVLHSFSQKSPLRESLSALKKAQIILLKKNSPKNKKAELKSHLPQTDIYEYSVLSTGLIEMKTDQFLSPDHFKQKKVLAFCGIAHPRRFRESLEEIGIRPEAFLEFPDHYGYPLTGVQKILKKHKILKSDFLITTEKDAIKLKNNVLFKDLPVYYLKIDLHIESGFFEKVFSTLKI